MKTIFRLEDVTVSYGDKVVVEDIDLKINEGEFCGLLGLNGSGKTTLLHAACGFIPMKGRGFVEETCLNGMNERQRARMLSFIPQISSLEGGRSVLEVVLMGYNAWLSILSAPSCQQKEEAIQVLEKLGCGHLLDMDFGDLSGGQRQMVILARCIVQNTKVMLMDEPDSALDFLNKHIVLEKIRHLIKEKKKAGLITMHDPNFAMAYCDRLLLLKQGKIVSDIDMKKDSMEEIRSKLSLIYGDIELLKNGNEYLMGKRW